MRRFSSLPLMHQPGEQWRYNTSAEVLGVLIARAARSPLEAFMRELIFEPLGMKDTAFSVPAAKLHRLPPGLWVDPQTGKLEVYDPVDGQWSKPPAFPSGGAGLVSTIDDYFAFGRMMLDRGVRVLSRASVAATTTDQLTPAVKAASEVMPPGYWKDHGWGFGLSVASDGRFGWDGGLGTSWYSDPKRNQLAILMTQRGEFPAFSPVYRDFWSEAFR
jgi:CubicO group peptidase (beta-lactamase class C family)